MAIYETELIIPRPVEETFAFVSEFQNAASWDPRTYVAEKATEGPVGVGTRFLLTGGLLPGTWVARLGLPLALAGMPLPYDVVHFEAPRTFTLKGESAILRWEDVLDFSREGEGTRLRYFARLELKGLLAIGEVFLRLLFKRIGDDATRRLPEAVVQASRARASTC